MNDHRKSPGDKSSNGKKQKNERKKAVKEKSVAAEIGNAVMREEAAKPAPRPASPAVSETPASKTPPNRESASAMQQAAAKPAPITAARPSPEAPPKPAPRPASPPAAEAPASKTLPPKPRPAPAVQEAKPRPAPRPAPPPASEAQPAKAPPKRPEPQPKPLSATGPAPGPVESAVETLERSLKAAGRGTLAVNCKLIDFARENVNCSLDHVKDLAAARNPVRLMRLQMEYWHDCLENFANQAEQLRALSAELVANANEPIREHMRRSLKERAA